MVDRLRYIVLPLVLAGVLLAFQNCGQVVADGKDEADRKAEEVVADASSFFKILYDPFIESQGAPVNDSSRRLEMNLKTGLAVVGRGASQKSCNIPADVLAKLTLLLTDAKICKIVLPGDVAVCLAYPMADIELSDDVNKQLLRPLMCAAEVFLCEGRDAELRSLIQQMLNRNCAP